MSTKGVAAGGKGCWVLDRLVSTFALGRSTSNEYTAGFRSWASPMLNIDFFASRRSEIVILTASGIMPCWVESHWSAFVVPLEAESAADVPPLLAMLPVPPLVEPPPDVPLLEEVLAVVLVDVPP
jgi:hypothetical protein